MRKKLVFKSNTGIRLCSGRREMSSMPEVYMEVPFYTCSALATGPRYEVKGANTVRKHPAFTPIVEDVLYLCKIHDTR